MIEYTLTLHDGHSVNFKVDPERAAADASTQAHPFWTRLDYHQCSNCPLKTSEHQHCPAALDVEQVVAAFGNVVSHDHVQVEVRTPDRTYVKETDVQDALRSLMGLCLATGGCPVLARMRGPARMHMPFASLDETVFRMVGAYLIGQYMTSRQGGIPDWDLAGLTRFYADLENVNISLKRRLDAAAEKDANINAVILLVNISMLVAFSLEQQLEGLKPYTLGANDRLAR